MRLPRREHALFLYHLSIIRFRVLGPLEVTEPNGERAAIGRRERAVLAALLASSNRVVKGDGLAEAMWGQQPPESSAQVVWNTISRLRKILGTEVIETRPPGYLLRVSPERIDAHCFERLVAKGRAAAATQAWDVAVAAFADALGLWRGTPFEDVHEWAPARSETARLVELRQSVREESAEAQLAGGRFRDCVPDLEALVVDEPYRDRAWALLMRALYRCDRQADALRVFQRARAALGELGLEPGSDLVALERAVSTRDLRLHEHSWPLQDARQTSRTTHPAHEAPRVFGSSGRSDSSGRRAPLGNLGRAMTDFVGRDEELRGQAAELTKGRLLTLTGTGGVGKSRLAVEVAWRVVEWFPAGVFLVELAALDDPDDVLRAVAATFSVQAQRGMALIEAIQEWLRGRSLLLILDNCEHLLARVAELVTAIVRTCPDVTVLTTSREPLGVPGERVHRVAPLDPASDGVALFCARAVAADDSFVLEHGDSAAIATICERLDGLPLAIELAAARVRSLSPRDLLVHLADRFDVLQPPKDQSHDRHQTLRDAIAWSYDLLTKPQQQLFERLSVFAGSFDLVGAQAVCSDALIEPNATLATVGSLVDKSMVMAARSRHGTRYRLLETLRQFGSDELTEHFHTDIFRDRHLAYALDLAEDGYRRWPSPQQVEVDMMFDAEWDNLRAAHQWALASDRTELAERLVAACGANAWCRMRHEHGEWAERSIAAAQRHGPARSSTMGWAAYWAFVAGQHDRSVDLARMGITVAVTPQHPDTAWCWAVLVFSFLASGRGAKSNDPATQLEAIAVTLADPFARSWAHVAAVEHHMFDNPDRLDATVQGYRAFANDLGAPSIRSSAEYYHGLAQFSAGRPKPEGVTLDFFRVGLELARTAGDAKNEDKNLLLLATAATRLRLPEAKAACREVVGQLYNTRFSGLLSTALEILAQWFLRTGDLESAAIMYGHMEVHDTVWDTPNSRRARERGLAIVHAQPHAHRLMASGAAMSRHVFITSMLNRLA